MSKLGRAAAIGEDMCKGDIRNRREGRKEGRGRGAEKKVVCNVALLIFLSRPEGNLCVIISLVWIWLIDK
jgi:hypothetical protein